MWGCLCASRTKTPNPIFNHGKYQKTVQAVILRNSGLYYTVERKGRENAILKIRNSTAALRFSGSEITMSKRTRTLILLIGLTLVCFAALALVYAVWPVENVSLQATLAPTLFVAP